MSSMPENVASGYTEAAEREDRRLDERIADIRRRQDAGELTVREAADERITAMETHLGTIRRLRVEHFGSEQ